jgi:hypothetical protein
MTVAGGGRLVHRCAFARGRACAARTARATRTTRTTYAASTTFAGAYAARSTSAAVLRAPRAGFISCAAAAFTSRYSALAGVR